MDKNTTRLFFALALAALPLAANGQTTGSPVAIQSAHQDSSTPTQPVHGEGRVETLVHVGTSASLSPGYNDIDKKGVINCTDPSGCLITINSEFVIAQSTTAVYEICSLIDGQPAQPPCEDDPQQYFTGSNLQSLVVAPGKHTVQTQFYDEGIAGALGGWEINYTLYRLKNNGKN